MELLQAMHGRLVHNGNKHRHCDGRCSKWTLLPKTNLPPPMLPPYMFRLLYNCVRLVYKDNKHRHRDGRCSKWPPPPPKTKPASTASSARVLIAVQVHKRLPSTCWFTRMTSIMHTGRGGGG
ncbi:hypothetical protein VPH35_113044 [Triticum aestivum]